MEILLNNGWLFRSADHDWAEVTLPHDWLITQKAPYHQSAVLSYRRQLECSANKEDERVFICFDSVFMDCTIWLNGSLLGEWKNGYTPFHFDITDHINRNDPNTLEVKINYQHPCERWYSGAGILGNVRLVIKEKNHFALGGVYITTTMEDGVWQYDVQSDVVSSSPYTTRHTLLGEEIPPKAWSVDDPNWYVLKSELVVDGRCCDTVFTPFGFRTIECTREKGLLLNGEPIRLKGVCLHNDLGALGAVHNRPALQRRLLQMKRMGANAVRSAHNPPSQLFMELCDEIGLLVLSELTDVWHTPKTPYDYARFFDEWIERDARAWIMTGRNHPSLLMWSIGNEIVDTHQDPQGAMITIARLLALIDQYDPKHNGIPTFCSNYLEWQPTQKCAEAFTVVGYNYAPHLLEEHYNHYPERIVFASESCSTVQSRGIYHFPYAQSTLSDDDFQCSSLGNSSTSWGSSSVEQCLLDDLNTPHSLGQFIWAGIDYLGEPTPYHTKNSYLGHVDTAGFEKDSYYLFKAAWSEEPTLHLLPYWDFNEGQIIDVRAYTNVYRVELFVNGVSHSTQYPGDRYSALWHVPYTPGVIEARSYDERGTLLCHAKRSSFGEVASLHSETERFGDLSFVSIRGVDEAGNWVENARSRVIVEVHGGTLLGLDNGDSTDYEGYNSTSRCLFSGKLLAIVRGDTPTITSRIDEEDIPVRSIELTQNGRVVTAALKPEQSRYNDVSWRVTNHAGIDSPLADFIIASDRRSIALQPKADGVVTVRCAVNNGRAHPAFYSQRDVSITGYGQPFLDPYSFISGGLYDRGVQELTNGNERGVATLRTGTSTVSFADLDFGMWGSAELTVSLFPLQAEAFDFEVYCDDEFITTLT
ncbi:MAG: glycoside hydrolase family 2 TIM barrel-domain containing protein, partial [Sphaerochaeta sp.]